MIAAVLLAAWHRRAQQVRNKPAVRPEYEQDAKRWKTILNSLRPHHGPADLLTIDPGFEFDFAVPNETKLLRQDRPMCVAYLQAVSCQMEGYAWRH